MLNEIDRSTFASLHMIDDHRQFKKKKIECCFKIQLHYGFNRLFIVFFYFFHTEPFVFLLQLKVFCFHRLFIPIIIFKSLVCFLFFFLLFLSYFLDIGNQFSKFKRHFDNQEKKLV